MKRCAICDYSEITHRDFTGAKVEKRKLLYNKRFQEYQCEACHSSLRSTKLEYWHHDVHSGKENLNDHIRYKERVYDVKPGMIFNPHKGNENAVNEQLNDNTIFEIPTALPPLLVE